MSRKFLTSVDLTKNELLNFRLQNLGTAPGSPLPGMPYWDTSSEAIKIYNGATWIILDAAKVPDGYIPITKLSVNPLNRSNHTGTQPASTVSDLATVVKGYALNEFAAPIGNVTFNGRLLTNLGDPINPSDAATKSYVDLTVGSAAAGIDSKPSVRVAAVNNVATLSGLLAIDGVTLVANDRVLLTGQTNATQNGTWIASSGSWTRPTDSADTITSGAFWFVEEGTTYQRTQWRCNNTGTILIGTTSIIIVQFGAASAYSAGNGLDLTGATFSVKLDTGSGLITSGTGLKIDTTVVARKYATTIGDGLSTSIVVTHGLGNVDIITSLRDIATNTVVDADVTISGSNTVTIGFAVPPGASTIRVVVIG